MVTRTVMMRTTIATVVLIAGLAPLAMAQPGAPTAPPEEQQLAAKIQAAPDPATKLKAAGDFVRKYPKGVLRPQVAGYMSDQIGKVADSTQRLALAQEYQKVFTAPSEQEAATFVMVDAYIAAKQVDEAFNTGAAFLTKNPDALKVLVALTSVGTEQTKMRNPKFLAPSLQYGSHAIELIEANKPPDMTDETWKQYSATILPGLYQATAVLLVAKGDRAAAKVRFEKAATLTPQDPFNFLMLGGLLNDDYQQAASHYRDMPNGPAKDEALKKAVELLDKVIDSFAHFVALAEGNDKLQSARQQYVEDLQTYYKYRHNGSTDGLQAIIDKYKPQPR